MIICERHGFVFVHIPKCAGSSVRQQIESLDDEAGLFSRVKEHPVLGRMDFGHFTLPQLREHFPDHYAKVLRLESFAICRDPFDRFGSSVRQTLWMYDKRPMTLISPAEAAEITRRMIDDLDRSFDRLPAKYVFFEPQVSYVFDEGRQVVKRLYPIERTADFIGEISRRIGRPLDPARRANQNVELRFKGLGGALFAVNAALRRLLPRGAHAALKTQVLPLVTRSQNAAEASGLLELPEVREFVQRRYAEDIALHRAAAAG
jgi:tetrahydromethanopterin S-methyltransferase subunit G